MPRAEGVQGRRVSDGLGWVLPKAHMRLTLCPSLGLAATWEERPPAPDLLTIWRPWSNAWLPLDSPMWPGHPLWASAPSGSIGG